MIATDRRWAHGAGLLDISPGMEDDDGVMVHDFILSSF